MMRLVLISLLGFSFQALACPSLSGEWDCHSSDGADFSLNIVQEPIAIGEAYHVKTHGAGEVDNWWVDGPRYYYDDGVRNGYVVSTCEGDSAIKKFTDFKERSHHLNGTVDERLELLDSDHFSVVAATTFEPAGSSDAQASSRRWDCIRHP